MPKINSPRGAAKRFKRTASGTFMRGQAFHRHILTSKTTKRKREQRGTVAVSDADQKKHGKTEQARQLVKEIYAWFTEGFDTPELREARELCS